MNLYGKQAVFKNQPIMCPWVYYQPHQSSRHLENKPGNNLAKRRDTSALNSGSFRKPKISESDHFMTSASLTQQSSSTHFFYFLRLMQLFPDAHPATLYTVLTLSKSNFFIAIDKLLYAQNCKSDLKRKFNSLNGRGRGSYSSSSRGRSSQHYSRHSQNQRYLPQTRNVPTDLAEVQRILDLAEKPYLDVQPIENPNETRQIIDDRIEGQFINDTHSYSTPNENEVIEIVCFDNDQATLKSDKDDDLMDIETFHESEATLNENININQPDEDGEPPVIVVNTIQESEDADFINSVHNN